MASSNASEAPKNHAPRLRAVRRRIRLPREARVLPADPLRSCARRQSLNETGSGFARRESQERRQLSPRQTVGGPAQDTLSPAIHLFTPSALDVQIIPHQRRVELDPFLVGQLSEERQNVMDTGRQRGHAVSIPTGSVDKQCKLGPRLAPSVWGATEHSGDARAAARCRGRPTARFSGDVEQLRTGVELGHPLVELGRGRVLGWRVGRPVVSLVGRERVSAAAPCWAGRPGRSAPTRCAGRLPSRVTHAG